MQQEIQDGLLLHTEERTCGNFSIMLLKEGRLGLTPLGGRALRCLVSSLSHGLAAVAHNPASVAGARTLHC